MQYIVLDKENGSIGYYKDANRKCLHNMDGPAVHMYKLKTNNKFYWINGVNYSKREWSKIVNSCANDSFAKLEQMLINGK
jgi:hypothetical protein